MAVTRGAGQDSRSGDASRGYVPAAGFRAFTRLYDPVPAVTMRERRFRGVLADRVTRDLPP